MDALLREVQASFGSQLPVETLLSLSQKLQAEFKEHLVSSPQCMLPSHNYVLPTGKERGTYLALEVGGSNLRVALVDLDGRKNGKPTLKIRRSVNSPITMAVRRLEGLEFFDWIAERIREMLAMDKEAYKQMLSKPIRMGVAWAFPIDQKSIRSGNVLGMGKGFRCSAAVTGRDLAKTITQACQRAGINTRLDAIVNDSSATLLSRAYIDSSTRMAMILGTGFNAAIHLPIASLHRSKFKGRTMPSTNDISHVLVNTELSMLGKHAFKKTRWDTHLNSVHIMPDYQPLEYLVAGGYISELVRLIMVEATESGLFGGVMPSSISTPYSLDARLLATIETDTSRSFSTSRKAFQEQHPSSTPPRPFDMYFCQQVIRSVTRRSAAFVTVGIHALTSLLEDMEKRHQVSPSGLDHVSIGCDGSIINKYPDYMDRCQELMDRMVELEGKGRKRVVLEKTTDSAVCGAGVAVAMAAMGK